MKKWYSFFFGWNHKLFLMHLCFCPKFPPKQGETMVPPEKWGRNTYLCWMTHICVGWLLYVCDSLTKMEIYKVVFSYCHARTACWVPCCWHGSLTSLAYFLHLPSLVPKCLWCHWPSEVVLAHKHEVTSTSFFSDIWPWEARVTVQVFKTTWKWRKNQACKCFMVCRQNGVAMSTTRE